MLSLFSRVVPQTPQLIISVGSGSVVASLLYVRHRTPSQIIDYERRLIPTEGDTIGPDALFGRIVELAGQTTQALVERNARLKRRAPSQCVVILHPPWATSETCEHEEVWQKEEKIADGHIRSAAQEALKKCNAADIIEKAVVQIEVNGYPTREPENHHGHRLRVVALVSHVATGGQHAALTQVVQKSLPGITVTIRSAAHMLLSALQPLARNTNQFTVVNVASESTGILLAKDGAILGHALAPIGWRALVRGLAKKYGTTPDEALSRLRMTIEDSCTNEQCADILSSLNGAAPTFIKAYGDALTELAATTKAPAHLVIVAPPDVAQWYIDLLSRIDFAQLTTTGQSFAPRLLTATHLDSMVQFVSGLSPDTGVAIAGAFVHITTTNQRV